METMGKKIGEEDGWEYREWTDGGFLPLEVMLTSW